MECLLPYLCMVTVPHIMVGLERLLDYRGVGLVRFHCMYLNRTDTCTVPTVPVYVGTPANIVTLLLHLKCYNC